MKVIIIGAGPSGLLSALSMKNDNNEVIILEKNNVAGKKLLLTGNSKCNYFNENFNINFYNSNNKEFLKKIITDTNKNKIINYLETIGIVPTINDGYYYPYSKTSSSFQNSLLLECNQKNIKIIYNENITKIEKINNKFIINDKYNSDVVVISTGSKAYPKTGSDGYFYNYLQNKGIDIIKPMPALVPLITDNKITKAWKGIRINASLSLYENDKFIKKETGELQLTEYGISGIVTMQLSSYIIRNLKNNKEEISINFLPNITNIEKYLIERNNKLPGRTNIELLEGLINYKLLYILLKNSKIENKKYNELTTKEKEILINLITNYKIQITDYKDFNFSQVCSGGVNLNELTENFELKKIKKMYTIGEITDVDGMCGGYNLAYAFISGYIAGKHIGGSNDKSKTNKNKCK